MKITTVLERTLVQDVKLDKESSISIGKVVDEMLEKCLESSYDDRSEKAKTITIDVEEFINEVRERRLT